jgi:hypothetical protein
MQVLSNIKFRLLLIVPLMLLALQSGIIVLHHHMDGSWYDQADPSHQITSPTSTRNAGIQKLLIVTAPFIIVPSLPAIHLRSVFVFPFRFKSPAVRSDVAVGSSTRNRAPPA